jgi:hypothetical protein
VPARRSCCARMVFTPSSTQAAINFSVAFQAHVEGQDRPLTTRIDVPYDQSEDSEDRYGFTTQRSTGPCITT